MKYNRQVFERFRRGIFRHRASIHAPAWGATWKEISHHADCIVFQSTPPRGGRQEHDCSQETDKKFQSTPPRGGRRSIIGYKEVFLFVSIHAPAWGATDVQPNVEAGILVSIHAPAWGATSALWE